MASPKVLFLMADYGHDPTGILNKRYERLLA